MARSVEGKPSIFLSLPFEDDVKFLYEKIAKGDEWKKAKYLTCSQ